MVSSAGNVPSSGPKFDDGLKAMLGGSSMVVLLVVVDIISAIEIFTRGQSQISGLNLNVFNLGALIIVVWLVCRANLEKIRALFILLAKSTTIGIAGRASDTVTDAEDAAPGCSGLIGNLWIPVTLQFLLVGWLIYATGGIINSPYSQVPIVMMVIGQSVYDTPPVESISGVQAPSVFLSVGRILRHYLYPLSMLIVLMTGLVLLQAAHPLVKRPAPDIEIVFTTLVNLFVSMCVVFVTRRADQAMAQG